MVENVWLFILDRPSFGTLSLHLISSLAIAIYIISESVSEFEQRGVKINNMQRDSL